MNNIIDGFERFNYYRDTALDVIIGQIKNGTIRCGGYSAKLKYGVPPKEIKGWWLTNDRHKPEGQEERSESTGSESDTESELRESKEDIVDILKEIDRRRDPRKRKK